MISGEVFKRGIFGLALLLCGFAQIAPAAEWQSEWDNTLAAAKKENMVAVITDVTASIRDALTISFQSKYGFQVDLFGALGREIPPRVLAERKAGRYLWDVFVHGTTTGLESMIPAGAFDPLEPALILPDIKDPKTWRGGMEFLDPNKMLLTMTPFQRGTIFYNPKLVNPKEFKSHKDLLDPKWRGKLILDDPRRAGPGQATFTFFYLHPELGPDFIRALGKQQITILKDFAQQVDAIGQGRYPVLIGTADFVAISAREARRAHRHRRPQAIKRRNRCQPGERRAGVIQQSPSSERCQDLHQLAVKQRRTNRFCPRQRLRQRSRRRVQRSYRAVAGAAARSDQNLHQGGDASEGQSDAVAHRSVW